MPPVLIGAFSYGDTVEISWIKLKTKMFDDEKIQLIEAMPEADAILVIWVKLLIQAGKINSNGYIMLSENIPYSPEMLSTVFRRPLPIIKFALKILLDMGMIEVTESHVICISNWEKHQNIDGLEKVREQNRVRKQKERERKALLLTENKDVSRDMSHEVTPQNKSKNKSKNKELKYSPTSFEVRMSKLLYNLILERNPKHKKPNIQEWAVPIDRMKRLDNRTEEEIEGAIRWCQNDEFWQNNILSTDKLKKQFDKLYLRAKGGKTRQGVGESELREAARIIANDPDLK